MFFVFRRCSQRVISIQNFSESFDLASNTVRSFTEGMEDIFMVFWVLNLSSSLVW